jgi:uncharacterized protein YecE (DUF72 family)
LNFALLNADLDGRSMTPSPLWIGTAGWNVPSRYAAEVPAGGSHLERYARRLNAVEINSSFYRPHRRKTYERWAQSVPAGFRFSVKVPKVMTHEQRLADCGALLDRFVGEVTGLGDKLGVLQVQLPPQLAFDRRVADRFFRDLHQRLDARIACEPRHASWFTPEISDWLTERRIARVAADPAPVPANQAAGTGSPIIAGTDRRGSIIRITTVRPLRRSENASTNNANMAFRHGASWTIPRWERRWAMRSH